MSFITWGAVHTALELKGGQVHTSLRTSLKPILGGLAQWQSLVGCWQRPGCGRTPPCALYRTVSSLNARKSGYALLVPVFKRKIELSPPKRKLVAYGNTRSVSSQPQHSRSLV